MTARTTAGIDENDVKSLLAVSSTDGESVVVLWADPVTHALLVKIANPAGLSVEVPPESPDGSRTTFTLSSAPKVVVVDQGRTMRSGVGWTYSGTTLTVDVAPIFDIFAMY